MILLSPQGRRFDQRAACELATRREIVLEPVNRIVAGENLYIVQDGERIKFSERAMLKLAEMMEFTEEGYFITVQGGRHRIRETDAEGAEGDVR